MKLTKIVATIGPASDDEDKIADLIRAGVDVFRFNLKHNDMKWHADRIRRVKKVAAELKRGVGVLIDLQGPELRVEMPCDWVDFEEGEVMKLGQAVFDDKVKGFSLTHPEVIEHLQKGQLLYAEDGMFKFEVLKTSRSRTTSIKALRTGRLYRRKNCNIPGADFPFPVLIDRDFEALKVAGREGVDYIALSFVRSALDLQILKQEMIKFGVDAKVIAKIETRLALSNFDEILTESDGVMVARGDLGVELPLEEVPYHQKEIIKKCIQQAKPVITATQMLQSMTDNPSPTRAEVSDIANAVYDLTDAVMLSAETATGSYPIKAVEVMSKTAAFNEAKFIEDTRIKYDFDIHDREQLVCDGAYDFYMTSFKRSRFMNFAGIIAFSETGRTVLNLAKYRAGIPIFAFVPTQKIRDQLMLVRGVMPFSLDKLGKKNSDVGKRDVVKVKRFLLKEGLVREGDNLILVHGDVWKQEGGTSSVKVIQVN